MIHIIDRYINFAIKSLFFLSTLLLFSVRSNYFFQNYLIIACLCVVFLIFLSGLIKTGSLKLIRKNLNLIDFLFVFDFLFNSAAVLYSHQPRVSIEEMVYQCSYIFVYSIIRASLILDHGSSSRIFSLMYIQIILFISKILYTVLYKFQFISVDGRISYNSMHPNLLASYMLISLSLIVYFIFKDDNLRARAFHVFAFLAIGFTLVMTSSRGGMLGLIMGLLAVFLVSSISVRKKLGYLFVLSSASLTFVYFIFPLHFQRIAGLLNSENYMTLGSRIHIWTFALKQFALNPLLGVGPAVCNFDIQQFSNSAMVDAHNFLLEKLCNVGITGTLIYLAPLVLLTRQKLKSGTAGAIKFFTVFLMAALFTNSFFSPHFVLPILSINLYLILSSINSLKIGAAISSAGNRFDIKNIFIDVIVITIFTFILSSALKIIFMFFTNAVYDEVYLWLMPVSTLISTFIYEFFARSTILRPGSSPVAGENREATASGLNNGHDETEAPGLEKSGHRNILICSSFALFLSASVFFIYSGFYYFAAEKANGLGIDSAMNFSAVRSKKYFSIALENDPQNIAYQLNKSFIVFIDEFFKRSPFKNNENVRQSETLAKRSLELFSHDQLLKSNYVLLSSKLEGVMNFDKLTFKKITPAAGSVTVDEANVDTQIILHNPHTSFAKFAGRPRTIPLRTRLWPS